MKVVINSCFGSFGLSEAAYDRLIELGVPVEPAEELTDFKAGVIYERSPNAEYYSFLGKYFDCWIRETGEGRSNPLVVQVVEELGDRANGKYAELEVIEIPDDVTFTIEDYEGLEHVAEAHRTWGLK